jgi:hypothetical protein
MRSFSALTNSFVGFNLNNKAIFSASSIPADSARARTMQSSREDAILLLKSWKDSGALIKCLLVTPENLTFVSWALVVELSESSVRFTGRANSVTFAFDGAEFEYSEPTELEANSELRRSSELNLLAVLAVSFPSGVSLLLGRSPGNLTEPNGGLGDD